MPRWMIASVLLMGASVFMEEGLAQYIHKCGVEGAVVYQSAPCPGAELKRWEASARALDPEVSRRLESIEQALERRVRQRTVAGRGGSQQRRAPVVSDCEKARRGRAAAYEKAGLKRGFALSSHWDNRVHQACNR